MTIYKFGRSSEKPFKERYLSGHQNTVEFIRYHPINPNLIVSCGDDKSIKFWDQKSTKFIQSHAMPGNFNERTFGLFLIMLNSLK